MNQIDNESHFIYSSYVSAILFKRTKSTMNHILFIRMYVSLILYSKEPN